MDQRSDQIVEHIEKERQTLGRNLDELQTRIKTATDWRTQFERHPVAMLGLAMGGGLLLGSMVGGAVSSRRSPSSRYRRGGSYSSQPYARSSYSGSSSRNVGGSYPGASSEYSGSGRSFASSGQVYSGSGRPSGASSYSEPSQPSEMWSKASSLLHSPAVTEAVNDAKSKAYEVVDNIKGALLGYAAAQAKQWLNQLLPGFGEHYDKVTDKSAGRSQQGSSGSTSYKSGSSQPASSGSQSGRYQGSQPSSYGSGSQSGSYGSGSRSGAEQRYESGSGSSSHTTSQTPNPRNEPSTAL